MFCKEIKTQEHQARTYVHINQQSNVNRKEIITCYCFSYLCNYYSYNPDWEESRWFSPDA